MFFQLPGEDERNGVIIGYSIEYRLISGGLISATLMENVTVSTAEERVTYILRGLEGDGTYEVQVGALTAIGTGPLTDSVTVVIFQGTGGQGIFC